MVTHSHNKNGHRRRELVKRVKAEETHCALCDGWLDYTLTMQWGQHSRRCQNPTCRGCVPHDQSVEVDEDIPRSRGGSPYDRSNCHAMHRKCNRYKSNMTLSEARARLHATPNGQTPTVKASPIW